jgi:thymidylate kinase
MNKLIIIESGDRLGKGTLIKGLCEYFDYKNITVRHCDKPPKDLTPKESFDFQFKCFEQEFKLIDYLSHINKKFTYHDNIIIYDRFYLGEFVYGQMFRNNDPNQIKNKILALEHYYLKHNLWLDVYLITLTADPQFFLEREDGNSFSKNLEEKTKELELFKKAHEFSMIKNKLLINVDKNKEFRGKLQILDEVINFIKEL